MLGPVEAPLGEVEPAPEHAQLAAFAFGGVPVEGDEFLVMRCGDLAVACLAGVRFAILFVYLIDDIVREAFVRIAVLGQFGFGIPNFSDRLRPIAYESVLAFLIAAALLVIWRLWQATQSPGP